MLEGSQFGQYELERKIGEGGMGEVYLAHDSRLERRVAIKVLPVEACCDPEKEKRFMQEARTASALNHPNIITIHDIGKHDGRTYIATELVDGEILRHRIERNEISLIECVVIAEQIASALSAAHDAGIVHRDIKPENIMIRKDGYVKVLDFGLAKISAFAGGAEAETVRLVRTNPGIVLGSVRYMSPEQARGKDVDQRSDIWSLGVVLYEMLTGKLPFEGETVSDTLANIIHLDPEPLTDLLGDEFHDLQRIIRRALEKDRDERYQTIKDLYLDLKEIRRELEQSSSGENVSPRNFTKSGIVYGSGSSNGRAGLTSTINQKKITGGRKVETKTHQDSAELIRERRSRRIWQNSLLGILLVTALGSLAYFSSTMFGGKPSDATNAFVNAKISRLTNDGQTVTPSISPDGKYVAFYKGEVGERSLVVRQLATESSVEIVPSSEKLWAKPVFSPDGNFIYYLTIEKAIGFLNKIPTLGGAPRQILVDVDFPPTFSPDGKNIAFVRHDPKNNTDLVVTASSDGSNPQTLLNSRDVGYSAFGNIAWSPDGARLLITTLKLKGGNVNEPHSSVKEFTFADKQIRETAAGVFVEINDIGWLRDGSGFLLNATDKIESPSQIWLVKYPSGEKSRVTNDVNEYAGLSLSADNASLVTIKSEVATSFWSVDPNSKDTRQITTESNATEGQYGFDIFPDERVLYTQRAADGSIDLMTMNADGTDRKLLTSSSKFNLRPKITFDGRYVVFVSTRTGAAQIWRMDSDGKNPVQLTHGEEYVNQDPQITADGKFVIFMRMPLNDTPAHFAKVSIDGGEVASLTNETEDYNFTPRLSPDGKRIAYQTIAYTQGSAESKRVITVRDFVNGEITGEPKEFDLSKGGNFIWNPDSKSLTIPNIEGAQNLYSLNLDTGQTKQITHFTSGKIANFSWTKDGKKLIMTRASVSNDLVLIQNPNASAKTF